MRAKKENVREVFPATIDRLIERAQDAGKTLTNADIAAELGIPIETFNIYYQKDKAPSEIFDQMRKKYKQFIGTLYIERVILTDEFDESDLDDED
jgi:AcrR family transcriptional regulator